MNPRTILAFLLSLLALQSELSLDTTARAGCNAIPPAAHYYPSVEGSVQERIALPKTWVHVRACPGKRFDEDAVNNTVKLTFEPGATTVPPISVTDIEVQHCLEGGECAPCTATDCNTLKVEIPKTDDAGPARITITRTQAGNPVTVAEIGELYEASSGCDKNTPEGVFEHFIVLPEATDITSLFSSDPQSSASQILMTLDGGGNLLLPLAHADALPEGDFTAIFEIGIGKFRVNEWHILAPTFAEMIKNKRGILGVFTHDGRPLPALFRTDDNGAFFGVGDAEYSVLRVAHTDKDGNSVYDPAKFKAMRTNGKGPIAIGKKGWGFFFPKNRYEAEACHPLQMVGLRVGSRVLAYSRDEALEVKDLNGDGDEDDWTVHMVQAAKGGDKGCGTSPGLALSRVMRGTLEEPVLEAGPATLAFLESEGAQGVDENNDSDKLDDILRVYSESGDLLTPNAVCETAPGKCDQAFACTAKKDAWSNGRSLLIEEDTSGNPLVYFRTPASKICVFDAYDATFSTVPLAEKGDAAGPRLLTVDLNGQAFVYDHETGTMTPLGNTAAQVAIGGEWVAATAPGADGGMITVWHWPPDLAAPGPPKALGLAADAIEVAGGWCDGGISSGENCASNSDCPAGGTCKGYVVLISPETLQGKDLNGDSDQGDRVLRFYNPDTDESLESEFAAEEFVASERWVAFLTAENAQSQSDLNGDTDTTDLVMHVIDLHDLDPGKPVRVITTGQPALGSKDSEGFRYGWQVPFKIKGNNLLFITRECDQRGPLVTKRCPDGGSDLDADGSPDGLVLHIFNMEEERPYRIISIPLGAMVTWSDNLAGVPELRVTGAGVAPERGSVFIGDQDRDGFLDPFDLCVRNADGKDRQRDDDLDLLGNPCDGECCTTFVPEPILRVSFEKDETCRKRVAREALRYARERQEAAFACLGHVESRNQDPTKLCLGGFVGLVENPPLWRKLEALAEREKSVMEAVKDCTGAAQVLTGEDNHLPSAVGRLVLRAYGEGVDATARVAFESNLWPRIKDQGLAAVFAEAEVNGYIRFLEEFHACLAQWPSPDNDADRTVCLGRIEDQTVKRPGSTEQGTSRKGDRLECINWRQAVKAVRSIYAVQPPATANEKARTAFLRSSGPQRP